MLTSIILTLPEPAAETHRLNARYLGLPYVSDDTAFEIKYETDISKTRFATKGQYRNTTDLQGLFRVEWGHDLKTQAAEASLQMLRKGIRREFSGLLKTPFYQSEDTFHTTGSFDVEDIYDRYTIILYIPATRKVANADVSYYNLANTKGLVNATTPFLNVSWLQTEFEFSSKE